ncbi:hypothetical protein FQA39_LY04745 [Lamprigera yunnana]|nr:hypothetical protein FQA39_LY04745 [Lamprigera yunnana]
MIAIDFKEAGDSSIDDNIVVAKSDCTSVLIQIQNKNRSSLRKYMSNGIICEDPGRPCLRLGRFVPEELKKVLPLPLPDAGGGSFLSTAIYILSLFIFIPRHSLIDDLKFNAINFSI